jgi:protoheme IX farnesyltransferase
MITITATKPGLLSMLLDLTRARITVAVTFTTATGHFLGAGHVAADLWIPVLGVFLLASGSSALNQWQDRRIDALMERTRRRPIPSGHIEGATAVFLAILLIGFGASLLASVKGNTNLLLMLGAFAIVWYNGVYTYLKRITAFAVVPGALIGAVPPVIGFVAAGGDLSNPLIVLVAAFFFVWQIPHFWLILLMSGSQYAAAGLPTLTSLFSRRQILRMTSMWLLATAAAGLVLPTVAPGELALPWKLTIVIASIWLAGRAMSILGLQKDDESRLTFRPAFIRVNVYALIVMLCLSLNALTAGAGGG